MPEPAPLDPKRPMMPRHLRRLGILLAVLVPLIIIGLFLEGFGRYREIVNRRNCTFCLHEIVVASIAYAGGDDQPYPNELGLLLTHEGVSAMLFICPSSSDTAMDASAAQQAATLQSGGRCSYVYVGKGMTLSSAADDVVAFDLPENHDKAGGNVVYGDARVSWVPFETLVQLVPELEAGRNPPVIGALTAKQAKAVYEQKWVPKLASIKDGTWAASLPRASSATRPSAEGK